ncbi:hypothetical protein ACJX0J_018195, partial [Zea mays]
CRPRWSPSPRARPTHSPSRVTGRCTPGAGGRSVASGTAARTTSWSPPRWRPRSLPAGHRGPGSSPSRLVPTTALRWTMKVHSGHGVTISNSLFPCFVEQFQDLGSPETLNDEDQNTRGRTCLK